MSENNNESAVIVDILSDTPAGQTWNPIPGTETNGLTLPTHARVQIVTEAQRILRRCVPPTGNPGNQTGLVIGYVQSGKTTSFITLAALARDNAYRIVVVIAGTTEPLFFQTHDRLVETLRLESRPRNNPWRHITQPKVRDDSHTALNDTLMQWTSPTAMPEERRTVLITVMKHHQHLQNLIDVLQRANLNGVPTLIIDDEGDQAGLNTLVNQGEESTTYRKILALKTCFPQHSYLQYTATPQAPLLISIVDVLSPNFAEILRAGDGYIGGTEFFLNQPNLTRDIPPAEIPSPDNPLTAPPPTLLEAMRLFFLGVSIGYITGQPDQNCSMMVHPSQRTDPHHQFYNWVTSTRDTWRQIMDLPDTDHDKTELMANFRMAYDALAATGSQLPSFETVATRFRLAISQTFIREINTRGRRRTPQINWGETYSWILVGGQAMDRGFTVEGLTITYMPRGLGIGNADTVQQRARFFGYKRGYLGLCRIFVGSEVRRAFTSYVEHEEDIRGELIRFASTERPLAEWRREFFLSRQLRPTRDNVIDTEYRRVLLGDNWSYPEGAQDSPDAVATNRLLFDHFRNAHPFQPYSGLDLRRDSNRNLVLEHIPLQTVHEELLTRFRVSRLDDSLLLGPLLRLIQVHLMRHPDDRATVFLMAEGHRRRRDYVDDHISELFQGRQYANQGGQRVITYPGDREIKATEGLTVQMNYLDLGQPDQLIAENIPHIAVWIPGNMARDTILQPQGGHT